MSEFLLQMEKISKIYPNGIVANRDVDFSLIEGEIHALVGENGAGKSTLMNILFGMEKPSSGQIMLRGAPLEMSSSKDAIASGIGMVHQHFMLLDSFTVAQNIVLGIEPCKGAFVDERRARAFTEELCEKYNFPIDPAAPVGSLPVGVKQKIEILKALARGAKILILDEPTAVLTPQETEQLFVQLEKLKALGHTIVFISHKIREVKKISSRLTVMRAGRCEGVFNTADVSEQEISNKIVGWDTSGKLEKQPAKRGGVTVRVENLCDGSGSGAVRNVSFVVRAGMVTGIAGVQGNGQVELVELLTQARPPQSGRVTIKGGDMAGLPVRRWRALGCAYIPEDRLQQGVARAASIRENLISARYASPHFCKSGLLRKKQIDRFADESIKLYEIKASGGEMKIETLSGGNMQKVVVARECSNMPEFLIAEQPTRGVDIGAARIIHDKIMQMRDAGSAVLLISADLGEMMQVCDTLMVMYEGKIVAYFDDVQQVTEDELGLYMLGVNQQPSEQIRRAADE